MFSPDPRPAPSSPARRQRLAERLRRAAELLVAFATLDDGGARGPEEACPFRGEFSRTDHAAALAPATLRPPAQGALACPPAPPAHPHRRPLEHRTAPRRHGSAVARPQLCLTPITSARAASSRAAWVRRAASGAGSAA